MPSPSWDVCLQEPLFCFTTDITAFKNQFILQLITAGPHWREKQHKMK